MATGIKLTILEGSRPGESTMFEGDRLTLGRAASCDLVLEDTAVSRTHAAIEREGDGFVLVDLESNNGTFVEGETARITRHKLKNGDQFTLGNSRIQVEVPEPAPAPAIDLEATMMAKRPAASAPAAPAKPAEPSPRSAPAPAASGKPSEVAAPSPPSAGAPEEKPTGPPTGPTPGVGAQQPSDLPIVLTVIAGGDRGQVFMPSKEVATIGRLSTSDVPLNDPGVSRLHATIKREKGGYSLYDENSRFGTEIAGQKVFHHELKSGDVIRLGDETEIRVEIGAGKGGEAEAVGGTLLSANIGDRTFAISLKSLGAAKAPRPAGVSDQDVTVMRARPGAGAPPPPEPPAAAPPKPEPPPPAKPQIRLRVVGGPDAGRAIEPPPGTKRFTIGRSMEKADYQIADPGISSLHFSITEENGEFTLADEGSRNGIFLDKKPEKITAPVKLKGGEEIRVGSTDIKIEILGAAKPAAATPPTDGTMVMAAPSPKPPPPPPPPAPAAAKPPEKKKATELVPELSRSAEAKQRISKIMKGVSLRPVRRPGTPRQWATVGLIAAAVLVSFLVPRTWVAAGPVYKGHADFEQKCETCHISGPSPHLLSVTSFVLPSLAMNESCASADCHGNVLNTRADHRDDCVDCHVDHRGRNFPIRGGVNLCWSCHRGRTEPQDYETRLMKISLTDNFELKAKLTQQLTPIETGLRFSHQAHDKETHGDKKYDQCTGCHASIDNGRTFAIPSHTQCLECHEKVVSADTKAAQAKKGPGCLQCHTREDGEIVKVPKVKFAYVKFAHKDHQNEFCKSCHAPIWEEGSYQSVKRDPNLYPVAMDACFTCHTQKSATLGCLNCHKLHHSFPPKETAQMAAGRGGHGFDGMLIGMFVLALGALGYVYADMRVAKRFLEPPPTPPVAGGGGAGPAPGGGAAAKEEASGEIMPFPKVDIEACISCGSCYGSCPKQVLAGDDHHKSVVVNPGSCIAQTEGCAVCEQGCPTGAIRVSTAPLKRTVERPEIDEHNEAQKLPGVFFAGEVIGAALIKSAINQGNQDVAYIVDKKPKIPDVPYDVIIVGAGPAGLGAGLEAKKRGIKFLMLERDTVASTIRNYPRDKAVLAEPIKMPLYGQLPMVDADKDTLIAMWNAVVTTTKLSENVHEGEEVVDVKKKDKALEVKTNKGSYLTANVILAIGTRGNPRKLGVPGEAAPRVAYNLIDPADFKGKSVIVVGGGDSAIEAAVALGRVEGCKCVLSYRRNAFARVKKRNQEQIDEMGKSGRIEVLLSSSIEEIRPSSVMMKTEAGVREITADQIFALIGADPPKGWIEKTIGVPFVMREEEVVTW